MTLTPEDRQRIYEEEKARLEAQERLKAEAKAREALSIPEAKRRPRGGWGRGFLIVGGVLVSLWILSAIIGTLMTAPSKARSAKTEAPSAEQEAATKDELLKSIGTMTTGLQDMNTSIVGETTEHIRVSLEVFDTAAMLLRRAHSKELSEEERGRVAELRRNLVLRQRQALPIIRDRAGPVFSKELWMSDGKARTFGERFTTIEFVSGSFVANANIATAHKAIRGTLIRMRFKRTQYKWYSGQDEYNYFEIDSPSDGEVAIIDLQGNVTPIPE